VGFPDKQTTIKHIGHISRMLRNFTTTPSQSQEVFPITNLPILNTQIKKDILIKLTFTDFPTPNPNPTPTFI
jgi:hypothetical protein